MDHDSSQRAILLLNLGGPAQLKDVKPFLYRLFKDPEILRIKFGWLRNSLAWLISTLREKTSQELYAKIGGGSPIRRYTEAQASLLEQELKKQGYPATVRAAFTCSDPFIEDVVQDCAEQGITKFLSFPLYPQYSYTTTRSGLNRTQQAVARYSKEGKVAEIRCWPDHPLFLKAHAQRIQEQLHQFSQADSAQTHLLFSAHSIPEKLVTQEGDPYRDHVEETVQGVLKESKWKGPWSLAWQSRLGPVRWLEPATPTVIEDLGKKGTAQVLIVPIAFVSDHIETLCEIDIEYAEHAKAAGIREFRKTEGLNTLPLFIQALTEIAKSRQEFWA